MPDRSGPASSCTAPIPSCAARVSVARWKSRRWAGSSCPGRRDGRRGGRRGSGGRSRPSRPGRGPRAPRRAGPRRRRRSGRRPGTGRPPTRTRPGRARRWSAAGAPASGSRPSRGRAAGGRRRRGRPARPGRARRRASAVSVRSRPSRARPVEVACTCASTKAGVISRSRGVDGLLGRAGVGGGADPGDLAVADEQGGRVAGCVHPAAVEGDAHRISLRSAGRRPASARRDRSGPGPAAQLGGRRTPRCNPIALRTYLFLTLGYTTGGLTVRRLHGGTVSIYPARDRRVREAEEGPWNSRTGTTADPWSSPITAGCRGSGT